MAFALRLLCAGALSFVAVAPFTPAHACACCSDEGDRTVGSQPYDDARRAEVERVRFAPAVKVWGADFEPDLQVTGIALAAGYTMKAEWQGDALVFALTGEGGQAGTLALARPDKIALFEVDPRQPVEGGMGPTLYKEWKLTGTVEATGAFAAVAGKDQRLTLILQGSGNRCSGAEDFRAWTLVMEGPKGNFTLFGDLETPG